MSIYIGNNVPIFSGLNFDINDYLDGFWVPT